MIDLRADPSIINFVRKVRQKITIPDGKIAEIQAKRDSRLYVDFISEHERAMVKDGLRLKEDLHGLQDNQHCHHHQQYPLHNSQVLLHLFQ